MFNNYDIVEMPLTVKRNRTMVENFLAKSGLRLDDMDYYAAVVDRENYNMLAGGGFKDDIIKCIAVDDSLRGTGMSQQLISHLMSQMNAEGHNNVKVFTKPGNIDIFESLGFKTLGESSKAILLENGLEGLSSYVNYLHSLKRDGNNGIIVAEVAHNLWRKNKDKDSTNGHHGGTHFYKEGIRLANPVELFCSVIHSAHRLKSLPQTDCNRK